MSANQMVGTVSGPHQGLDSGYIEKSITQFRKPQRAKKAKHFVRKGSGHAGELKVLSKSREIIRGICKLKEHTAFSQTAWEYLHVAVTGLWSLVWKKRIHAYKTPATLQSIKMP